MIDHLIWKDDIEIQIKKKRILSTIYKARECERVQYTIQQNPQHLRRSIHRSGVIGVTFRPIFLARFGLQMFDIGNIVEGLPVLNTFSQLWVRDPVEPDTNRVNLAKCHELLALFGEDTSVKNQFGVLDIWTVGLEDVVRCRTFHT
jgi:hypothetical protein